uniref:SRS domain-containing protein n=1 Tax=Sarcocystis aucheniae TaxID=65407 RepID=A0A5P9S3M2_9APIC|nr:hypothetical protein [Sarcocystis aucheniae]
MAVIAVTVILAVAAASLVPSPLAADEKTNVSIDCGAAGVQKGEVTAAQTTVTVTCAGSSIYKPAIDNGVTKVLTGPKCDVEQQLIAVCPGASGKKSSDTVTFDIAELPPTSRQFCLQCGPKSQECMAQVYLKVPGSPPVCETLGGNITLNVPASGNQAAFACAYGLHLTPTNEKKVFAEDCTTEEDLPKMTLAEAKSIFTVTATENPPNKKLCYLCGPQNETMTQSNKAKFCSVFIQAGAGARPFFHGGLSVTLPCLLAALHFT